MKMNCLSMSRFQNQLNQKSMFSQTNQVNCSNYDGIHKAIQLQKPFSFLRIIIVIII